MSSEIRKIFNDEFPCNILTQKSKFRAVGDERVYQKEAAQQRRNICLPISTELGLIYYEVKEGGQTKKVFGNFLQRASGNVIFAKKTHLDKTNSVTIFVGARRPQDV